MSKVRILSIDGGGLRGIVPLLILKELEKHHGKKIHELFDVIVGTSTGGIIACGLTCTKDGVNPSLTIDQLIELYTTKGNQIFPYSKNIFKKIAVGVNSVFNPKFSPSGLDSLLENYFGDMMLSQSLKPIIVSSYDLKNNEVVMFKTRTAKWSKERFDAKLKDVCRATSAAPTYLPSYEMEFDGKDRILVDGGVYINNPALAAVADILKTQKGIKLEDIECLSLGTGSHADSLGIKTESWGIANWAQPITTVMMQASSKAVVYECEQILDRFLRVQLEIDDAKKSDMSDSRPATTQYIIDKVNKDIIGNKKIMNSIKKFITM
jgi:patatin-like phospholipase/acyl hydrolase